MGSLQTATLVVKVIVSPWSLVGASAVLLTKQWSCWWIEAPRYLCDKVRTSSIKFSTYIVLELPWYLLNISAKLSARIPGDIKAHVMDAFDGNKGYFTEIRYYEYLVLKPTCIGIYIYELPNTITLVEIVHERAESESDIRSTRCTYLCHTLNIFDMEWIARYTFKAAWRYLVFDMSQPGGKASTTMIFTKLNRINSVPTR